MKYPEVIKHFGNISATARALSMSRPGVRRWKKAVIPYPRQLHIQEASGGKLKAKNGNSKMDR